jgi:hypothetical protein
VAIQVCFTEDEVGRILWVLDDAKRLAEVSDALSILVLVEEVNEMVWDRFDQRREE